MRTFMKLLRIFSAITLFFFCWSFLPIYAAVAYAAEPPAAQGRSNADPSRSPLGKGGSRGVEQTSGERFEKALEAIREKINRADEKESKGQDPSAEIAEVKTRRAEIDTLDGELRNEFAATEKKLKDAKLPQEILDRHYKFVKHYDDNLKELKANLDAVDKYTVNSKQGKDALKKAKLHLEKTKTPSKHVPLDPNKLPFRNVKGKERAPRLKKEEFEKEFGPQKKHQQPRTAELLDADQRGWTRIVDSAIRRFSSPFTPHTSRALLAYNGPASDIPLQLPLPEDKASLSEFPLSIIGRGAGVRAGENSELATPNLLVAQATGDLPTAADLAESPEIQLTQDILNLAEQLEFKPTKIYEWVRNNIEFVPSYGSIQGADMCLQSRQCNAMDTSSLLIALLRASNRPARYVYGTIELPMDKVMNWVGGFTDEKAAISFMASGGIPVSGKLTGGKITAVRMEHAWVETYIPYGNYRGAIMDDSLKTWIPMDGSFKQYTYTNGFDVTGAVPFSQEEYLSQVQSQNAIHYYQSKIQEYLDANMPDKSIVDVKGYREITQETYHFLPSTLAYKPVTVLGTFTAAPFEMTAKVTFTLSDAGSGVSVVYTATTPELAGKRITVSYIPATMSDEALIENYGGYIYGVPAYMLNLKPVVRINGEIKQTGSVVTMGNAQSLDVQFVQPAGNLNESIQKKIVAGTYYALGMDLQGINENVIGKRNSSLTANVLSESAGTLGKDEFIGEYLYIRALMYFFANDKINKSGAKLFNTTVSRTVAEAITSFPLTTTVVFGMAKAVAPAGVEIDVAMDRLIAVSRNGEADKERSFTEMAGLVSSYHEHSQFENIDGYISVSAVRALQLAAASGLTIYRINAGNIAQILPTLQVGDESKADIQNAVNAGKEVTSPQANIQYHDWQGVGYIVKDANTGSGTYRITGGLGGGSSVSKEDAQKVAVAFMHVLTWAVEMISYALGGTIAEAAELNVGDYVVDTAEDMEGMNYDAIKQCSGLVRIAYYTAGICIDPWSPWVPKKSTYGKCGEMGNSLVQKHKTSLSNNGVGIFYELVKHLQIEGREKQKGIRFSNDPIRGDLVFFDNTFDSDGDCKANDASTHVGIVKTSPDANGDIYFIHATRSGNVVTDKKMNMTAAYKEVPDNNTYMRANWQQCLSCPKNEVCPATNNNGITCNAGTKPNACTKNQWDSVGKLSGELFAGFGTIRDVSCGNPDHK